MLGTLVLIGIGIPQTTHSNNSEALQGYIPFELLSDNSPTEQVKQAVVYVAKKYLLDESELAQVIKCESGFYHDQYGDGTKAYGLLQFHKPTFNQYCEGNYYSAKDQLTCVAKMWKDNPLNKLHWSCWKTYFTH